MIPTTIAIFVKNLTIGGAEKQAVLLAKALSIDYDVHFIVFNAAKTHQKYLDLINETPEIRLALFNGGHISRFCQFCTYIKRSRIELIFSYLTAANLYACLAGTITGAKVVTGLRNAELPSGKLISDRFLTNHLAVLTIANCFSGKKNFVSKGFKEKKIHVIQNCFDNITPFAPKDESDVTTIITVGRFVEQKDYLTAIKSVAKAYIKCNNIRFCIIGFGELEQQIRAWVKEEGIAGITDILINPDNISQYLNKADIYLSTSLFEGTSNSIMEGMNANLPIVATNVGDNSCLVKDGENGFLAEKRDIDSLAHNLMTLIMNKNMRQQFGKRSKEILYDNYSLNTFQDRYIQTIKEL
jgi:glycosyltransferase involved in cell wall biosynthesis